MTSSANGSQKYETCFDFMPFPTICASFTIRSGSFVQRLFSTFANGWPGAGLLLQRILTATLLVHLGFIELTSAAFSLSTVPQLAAAAAGLFLLVGLWTPFVGVLMAVIEVWIALTHTSDLWMPIVLATLGITAAMIGPGAWSVDARLFGRKHMTT